MTEEEYTAYFKDKAEKLAPVKHVDNVRERFFEADVAGFIMKPPETKETILILEVKEENLQDNQSDNFKLMNGGSLLLVKHINSDDTALLRDTYGELKELCWELVRKMREEEETGCSVFQNLQLNRFRVHPASPAYLDSYYGARLEFDFATPFDMAPTPSLWL